MRNIYKTLSFNLLAYEKGLVKESQIKNNQETFSCINVNIGLKQCKFHLYIKVQNKDFILRCFH